MSKCPRCHGTGSIEEQGTLVGLAPFQDRPSTVDDNEWKLPEDDGEATSLQEVPVFKMPEGMKNIPRIPSPKPSPSERPTTVVNAQEILSQARTDLSRSQTRQAMKWPLVLFCTLTGAVAGVWLHPWITFFVHEIMPRWRSW